MDSMDRLMDRELVVRSYTDSGGQCLDGDQLHVMSLSDQYWDSNIFTEDTDSGIVSGLWMTPSCVAQLTCPRDRMPFRET